MTTTKQLLFIQKGLKLKDVFVYFHLQQLKKPTSLNSFLKINPLIDLTMRNLQTIIYKLEKLNMLVKFKTSTFLVFIFPFLRLDKKGHTKRFMPCYLKQKPIYMLRQKLPITYTKYNYINNVNKKHNFYNIISHNLHDDDIMYRFNKLNSTNKFKRNNYFTQEKHKVVVNKDNFSFVNNIKINFKKEFPKKNNYLTEHIPENFNYDLFIQKIKESPFLSTKDNLGLSWLIKRYDWIVNNQYKPFDEKTEEQAIIEQNNHSDFSQRTYTKEELDNLFDDLSDIEI